MDGTDVVLTRLVQLAELYERTGVRLGEMVRRDALLTERFPLYRELIDLSDELAALLENSSNYYRQRAESWREGLDRLHRYAGDRP